MSENFHYDVFLSHSSKDKPIVRELAERLRADGVRVWLDEWIIKPGDSIPIKIAQGLEHSRILVLAISANASESDWVEFEHQTVLFNDPTNKKRRFIPLKIDNSESKFHLKQFAYIDWRNRDEEEYQRLLSAIFEDEDKARLSEIPKEVSKEIETIRILKRHSDMVTTVAISPDDRFVISGSKDTTIRIWDTESGRCLKVLRGHFDYVWRITISPDGKFIVSGSYDETVKVWDMTTGNCLKTLQGHSNHVLGVAISLDGEFIVSGSVDKTVRVWNTTTGNCLKILKGHGDSVFGVAISPNGRFIISGSKDTTIRIWDTESGECLKVLRGHFEGLSTINISPDGKFIVSGSADRTIKIWDMATGKCLKTLEGHYDIVLGAVISSDRKFIISGSSDATLRIWDMVTGKCLKILKGHSDWVRSISISKRLIISGSSDNTVRIWDISDINKKLSDLSIENAKTSDSEVYEYYTNAKVLLVGDSGVGKSGLAHRLINDEFVETISTDGVWATQMKLEHDTNTANTEREIWLWDFAGQSDYRLIHQLFMDETSLAVLVFNPQHENPFEGLGQWDRDLQKASRRPFNKLLVAGRCDRGGMVVSQKTLDDFKDAREFAKYLETSALTGDGCHDLRQAIIEHINWNDIPHRTSPRIFKLLKEEIIKLKDEGKILLRLSELKQNLEMRLPNERFSFDELKTVVGLLAGSGVVWQLDFGDFVLLQPEKINSYAAAVVRSVRKHTDEIGCIAEEKVLAGELDYQDMQRLEKFEEEFVLRAMHQTFVERGLCLREKTDEGRMLVFPSYFRRERPKLNKHPTALVTYKFSGMLDEIYATLIVRLHYTTPFDKDQLWRYAADFKTTTGKRIGLKMTKKPEGAAEITIYLDKEIPDEIKVLFIRYVHEHLKAKDENVERIRHYVCPNSDCGEPVESQRAIDRAIEKKAKEIPCQFCFKPIPLKDLIEEKFASDLLGQKIRKEEEKAQNEIDNESRELILVGHAYAIAGEAGQIFRQTSNSDWGIDGEIEFKDYEGKASGKLVHLQLKSGDSYLKYRKRDEKEVFYVEERHVEYWLNHDSPVMLVVRTSDGETRWMNATEYLKKHGADTRQIVFEGEPFTALNVIRLRDKILGKS